jgi:predicted transcriptional regulator
VPGKAGRRQFADKIVDDTIILKRPRRGAKLREEVTKYISHTSIISSAGWTTGGCSATTTAMMVITGTSWGMWSLSVSPITGRWRNGFRKKCVCFGDRKMNKTVKSVIRVGAGTADAFFRRSAARAQELDRGVKLLPEMRLTFEDPVDLLQVLTEQRILVLDAVRRNPAPVSELAAVLKRDRTAVRRDVRILTTFGLVKIHEETNPGHGRRKIVAPLASKCELVTTI